MSFEGIEVAGAASAENDVVMGKGKRGRKRAAPEPDEPEPEPEVARAAKEGIKGRGKYGRAMRKGVNADLWNRHPNYSAYT
jgi:hypothetical protein